MDGFAAHGYLDFNVSWGIGPRGVYNFRLIGCFASTLTGGSQETKTDSNKPLEEARVN